MKTSTPTTSPHEVKQSIQGFDVVQNSLSISNKQFYVVIYSDKDNM